MKMRWMMSVALAAGVLVLSGCKTSEKSNEFEPVKKKPSAMTPAPVPTTTTPPAPVAFEKVKKSDVSVSTPPAPPAPGEFEKVSKPPAPAEFEKVSKPATVPPAAEFEKVTKPAATGPAPAEFDPVKKGDPQK